MRKMDKWTVLCVGGENREADQNLVRKWPCGSGVLKHLCPALSSSVESSDKIPKKDEIGQIDNRNQERYIYLIFNFVAQFQLSLF